MQYIIFTDLDGTLIDHHTYSYADAQPALDHIRKHNIPLVLVSSKTRAELLFYRNELHLHDFPFVVENGAAVFFPLDLFKISLTAEKIDNLACYRFGRPYEELKSVLDEISQKYDYRIRGFHNTSANEIAKKTGLAGSALTNAMQREFSVPLFYDKKSEMILVREIPKYNLGLLYGGRFMHLVDRVNKGDALKLIMEGYSQKYKALHLRSVAIGDSQNDYAMLKAADIAVLVKRFDGTYESRGIRPRVTLSPDIGPSGWNISVLKILQSGGINE